MNCASKITHLFGCRSSSFQSHGGNSNKHLKTIKAVSAVSYQQYLGRLTLFLFV